MAKRFISRVTPNSSTGVTSTGVRINPAVGRRVGEAASGLAGQGARLGASIQGQERAEFERQAVKAQAAADGSWVSKHVSTAKKDWLDKFHTDSSQAERGAPNFAENFTNSYSDFAASFLENAPTEQARLMAQRDLDSFGIRMADKAMVFEANSRVTAHKADLQDSIHEHANRVISNPEEYPDALNDAMTALALARTFLPAEDVAKTTNQINNTLTEAMIRGVITENPSQAMRILDGGDVDALITPNQKETLVRTTQIQLDRIQAKRRAQAAAAVTRLRKDVNDAVHLIENGIEPATLPALRSQLSALGATPGAGDLSESLSEALEDRDKVQQFRTLRPTHQQQLVSELRQSALNEGLSVDQGRTLLRLEKSMKRTQAGYRADPYSQGIEDGIITAQPTFNNWTDPDLLKARELSSAPVAEHAGRTIPPFSTEELQSLGLQWETANADERVAIAGSLAAGLSQDALKVTAAAIAPKDPTFALAAVLAQDAPDVSREVVLGQDLVKDKVVALPSQSEALASAQEALGDVFSTSPSTQAMVLEAAKAHYSRSAFQAGQADVYDPQMFEESLTAVAGNPFKHNDKWITPPVRGMTKDNFETLLQSTQLEDLVRFGSVFDSRTKETHPMVAGQFPTYSDGTFFNLEDLEDADLHQIGDGQYMIFVGNGFLAGPNNLPFVLDLGKLAHSK